MVYGEEEEDDAKEEEVVEEEVDKQHALCWTRLLDDDGDD
jgi:hypothetical protein